MADMAVIQLNKATPEMKDQLDFLIRCEFSITYKKYRKHPFYLLAATIFVFALIIFTDNDSLIILKSMSIIVTALSWVIALIFLAIILIKLFNRARWKRKGIREAFSNDFTFEFSFDKEKLHFISTNFNIEMKWEYFSHFVINNNSIFLFPPENIYSALYYSQRELGLENYELLKSIAAQKLILREPYWYNHSKE